MRRLLHCYKSLPSTNDTAKDLARQGAVHGTAVIAEAQSAGRGTRGRTFLSPVGGLYLSVILRPARPAAELTGLTLSAGEIIRAAIAKMCPQIQPTVKPINDILIDGKKVCGILTEGQFEGDGYAFVVIGVGINIDHVPQVEDQPVTCLKNVNRLELAELIIEGLLKLEG
ncbi:hypothetical protein FACS1894217_15660 [Clostridia bacterium]|nr:hypothetical protein FACS1894217_15660 [Clostridia bacterium]